MERISYTLGKQWFVVRTNIRCENRAQLGLDAKGYRTFCPKLRKWISHARVRSLVDRPLLTRHFFAEIDPNKQGFGEIRSTDGVEGILGTNGTPAVVPSRFVEEFIKRQISGEFDYTKGQPLTAGCRVAVVGGEYDGFFGIIQNAKQKNGRLFVKLLETAILARIPLVDVRAA